LTCSTLIALARDGWSPLADRLLLLMGIRVCVDTLSLLRWLMEWRLTLVTLYSLLLHRVLEILALSLSDKTNRCIMV